MLDSINHMTSRLLFSLISGPKILSFCNYLRNVVIDVIIILFLKSVNHK